MSIFYSPHAAARSGPCGPRPAAVLAATRIVAAGGSRGSVGVVLGTGLGELVTRLENVWSMEAKQTQWLPESRATGHAGRIATGTLNGTNLVVLQGRVHGYEGLPAESLTRGVELLAALGATTILLTNASGGLRADMQTGEVVVISDHIDFVRQPWSEALLPTAEQAGNCQSAYYDAELSSMAMAATRRAGTVARSGVYAYFRGPSYETRAEYRLLRQCGADVVGMSTVPEVVASWSMGLRVVVVSVVTNVALPDAITQTDAEEVCRMAGNSTEGVWGILATLAAAKNETQTSDTTSVANGVARSLAP